MNPGATTHTKSPLRCRLQIEQAGQAQRDLFVKLSQLVRRHWLLLVIMGVGLAARMPGVLWGFNYPTGWAIHHIDEYTHLSNAGCLINPSAPQGPGTLYLYGCTSNYPRGLATHVALPDLLLRAAENKLRDPLPAPTTVVAAGRLVSVFYGVATIPLIFLVARLFFSTQLAVPYFSAAFFALGGLHVSQSHFFVADVPVIFWLLLALYLIGRFVELGPSARPHYINFAALACGMAIGIKFSIAAIPSLVVACVLYPRRLARLLYAAVFLAAGICVANLDSFSLYQFHRMLQDFTVVGMRGYHFSRIASAGIYLLEIPSIISFPVSILAIGGVLLFSRKLLTDRSRPLRPILLVFLLPNLIGAWFVFFKADNAPRHLLVFLPWIAIAASWALNQLTEALAQRGMKPVWVAAPVFLYLAVFVFDGERVFFEDPRNRAVEWLLANVPKGAKMTVLGTWRSSIAPAGYTYVDHEDTSTPDVIVSEMHYANMFLSGMGLRDSYPQDSSTVWPWFDDAALHGWQALFKGSSPYAEAARFSEGYFMPEYVWTDRLIGNRMRNFVGEVVIFRRVKGEEQTVHQKTIAPVLPLKTSALTLHPIGSNGSNLGE